jgi:hypothetical protein
MGAWIWRLLVLGGFVVIALFAYAVYALAAIVPVEQRFGVTVAVGGVFAAFLTGIYCLLKSAWWVRYRAAVGATVAALAGVGVLVFALIQAKGI